MTNRMVKILIVDDEPNIRFYLAQILSRDGREVKAVESGKAALEEIEREEFDLALIDLKLKDMSGMEVLAHVRQRSPDTAVIVLTGYASLDTAVEALRQGAHDYLFKPAKTVELRESVRTALLKRRRELRRRELLAQLEDNLSSTLEEIRCAVVQADETPPPPPEPEAVSHEGRFLRWGGLIVDVPRHVVTLDGTLLELSPTEFDMLAYLASEAPRVVPPQELVREVQGYESEIWEARDTVRYHVYRIRRKFREVTEREVIETVRGVGYALATPE
jgi:DNA-binding response OmpR family regulator